MNRCFVWGVVALVALAVVGGVSGQSEQRAAVTAIKYSNSGQTLFIGLGARDELPCGQGYVDQEKFGVYKIEPTSKALKLISRECSPTSFAVSPDNTMLASVSLLGREVFFDIGEETPVEINEYGGRSFIANDWSDEGIYVSLSETYIRIYNAESSDNSITFEEFHTAEFTNLRISPRGSEIVTTSQDGTAAVWEIYTHQVSFTFTSHQAPILAVDWQPFGDLISTGDESGNILVWDAKSGTVLHSFSDHNERVNELDWSPDGTMLASASEDETVRVWNAESGDLLESFTYTGPVYARDWSPDGTQIAFGGADTTGSPPQVVIVDAPQLPEVAPTPTP